MTQPTPDRSVFFKREERYMVIKYKDAQYLSLTDNAHLSRIGKRLEHLRANVGKQPMTCVVVESDWPEYETVFQMIEARVTGKPTPPTDRALVEKLVVALEDMGVRYGLTDMARAALTAGRAALAQTQGEDWSSEQWHALNEGACAIRQLIREGYWAEQSESIAATLDSIRAPRPQASEPVVDQKCETNSLVTQNQLESTDKALGPVFEQGFHAHPQASEPALSTEDQCFCDANNLGVRGVSCGDCPRDYKQEPAPSKAGEHSSAIEMAIAALKDLGSHGAYSASIAEPAIVALLQSAPVADDARTVWELTDEQIDAAVEAWFGAEVEAKGFKTRMRLAIAAAHKIGGQR